jgi:serine/threonine-protein kinase
VNDHLEPGRTLLHYRLVDKLGEGGMGVVWRALDTTLDREVAIKVLPPAFAADAERIARFDREARLLASLNHPHIAGIYGVHKLPAGEPGGTPLYFLSMELVPGEDLSAVVSRGALPVSRALALGREIAEAVEVAHDSGVIHRDLKPANVRLTADGKAKVLDFGLAKGLEGASSQDPSLSPTMTSVGTMAGVIVGTAAYMSPEQAAGQPTDRRCDIWSFGVMMHEMLTGARIFAGETVSHTLADVLRKEIDLADLPRDLPPSIRRLLERCLERDPKRRLRDIGEARIALDDAIERPQAEIAAPAAASAPSRKGTWVAWAVAAVATIIAVLALVRSDLGAPTSSPEPVRRFSLAVPNSGNARQGDGQSITISSDGRYVVTRGGAGADDMLYLRALDDFEAVPIEGTSGGREPQFGPDDRWIAYLESTAIKKISRLGGAPVAVGWLPGPTIGFEWADDGRLYYGSGGHLWRIPSDGGEAERLTDEIPAGADASAERRYGHPSLLPGGRFLLCNTLSRPGRPGGLYAFDLEARRFEDLEMPGTNPTYLATGHLLFAQDQQAMVAPFDLRSLRVTGTAVPVLPRAWVDQGHLQLAVADNGTVAYMPQRPGQSQALVRVDRTGKVEPLVREPLPFSSLNDPRISPDGRRLALNAGSEAIWVLDLDTETPTLVGESGFYPLWSPDGRELIFSTARFKSFDLMRVPVDLSRPEELLLDRENNLRSADWTAQGVLVVREEIPEKGMDLRTWTDLDDEGTIEVLMDGPDDELAPIVSPDGRFMAYVSDYSGRDEVYVTSFPRTGGRTRISVRGGNSPTWAPDASEIYYLEGTRMIAVRVETDPAFRVLEREKLFEGEYVQYRWSRQYDIDPDGNSFVMIRNPDRGDIEVVTNWFEEVREAAR